MSKRHSFTLRFHKARCIIIQNKRAKHTFATLEDEQCCYIPFLGSWPLTNILLAMVPFQNKLDLVFPHMWERAFRVLLESSSTSQDLFYRDGDISNLAHCISFVDDGEGCGGIINIILRKSL